MKLLNTIILVSITVVSFGAMFHTVSAHSEGLPLESIVGTYLIDVGTDIAPINAGAAVRFDFELKDAKTEESKPYEQTWVRITDADGTRTWLATGLHHQPVGPTTLLYIFDQPGAYALNVSFRDADGDDIATTTFALAVTGSSDSSKSSDISWPWLALGVLLGALMAGAAIYGRSKS